MQKTFFDFFNNILSPPNWIEPGLYESSCGSPKLNIPIDVLSRHVQSYFQTRIAGPPRFSIILHQSALRTYSISFIIPIKKTPYHHTTLYEIRIDKMLQVLITSIYTSTISFTYIDNCPCPSANRLLLGMGGMHAKWTLDNFPPLIKSTVRW